MGFLSDIRKKFVATPSNGLDGYGERSSANNSSRGRTGASSGAASRGQSSQQQRKRPTNGLDAGSDSQDSGVVILEKETVTKMPDHACPNCAAHAASASRTNLANSRPSVERLRSFSSSRQQPLSSFGGHTHEHHRHVDAGHDQSRPGTGYSNHSGLPPMQSHPNLQQDRDPGFSSRPVSWGRRATTENVGQDGPCGYTRPVTPPYSIRSEQTGWNSGQQYNDMYGHAPGPASVDGDFTSQRPTSWRRATSSHFNSSHQERQPRSMTNTSQNSRTPSETGSTHPRNTSKSMENTAYEAGYRDAIARLKADSARW